VELTEHHRRIYGNPTFGGDDPGNGLDGYLATGERIASWVAELDGDVVGLAGLFGHGTSGEVEPLVVTEPVRGRGIGRELIQRVSTKVSTEATSTSGSDRSPATPTRFEASTRSASRPSAATSDLTMDLAPRRHQWRRSVALHGKDFQF
jgi:GNAT superfamily N-acetyltransferase